MLKKFVTVQIPLYVAIIVLFLFSGVVFVVAQVYGQTWLQDARINLPINQHLPVSFAVGSWPALEDKDFFQKVRGTLMASGNDFIEANLSEMKLRVYHGSEVLREVPILTKGRPGSWWETPAGLYQVGVKGKNIFSGFGQVYMPWSMQFEGNFFIHGWPYHPDGTPVATQYSGGCIRLSTDDAKLVYDLVTVGTPVLVYADNFTQDNFSYNQTGPNVSAQNILAADLKNNFVFLEKGSTTTVPIASITKLVSALVVTEYVNLDKTLTIDQGDLVFTSVPRLKVGDEYSAFDLLYPMMMESSNEAAFALSRFTGTPRFIQLMNQKAKSLGMEHATFVDPAGMNAGNVASAQDLFHLAKYLYNNRSFILKMTAGKARNDAFEPPKFTNLQNFNIFEKDPDFVGGKVGEIPAAGQTILSVFNLSINGERRPVVIIALGSRDRAADATAILNYIKGHYFTD